MAVAIDDNSRFTDYAHPERFAQVLGERSSHTWFVLTHLLGFDTVRNYDGSWTEWGNAVRVPIEVGAK
jgi:3-mercaptopyruvate sulfurtransferase SseA